MSGIKKDNEAQKGREHGKPESDLISPHVQTGHGLWFAAFGDNKRALSLFNPLFNPI